MADNCCRKFALVILTACYMCNSALMLISNKLAIHLFPHPIVLLILQLGTSWFVMFVLGLCILDVDACSWTILKKFWPVPLAWLAVLFSGLKAVQYANVETFIVFRATTPIVLSFAEWCFLGRQLPNLRSSLCLALMLVASLGYTLTDSFFRITGYMWILVWYCAFLTEFLLVKHKVDTVAMTNWVRKGHRKSQFGSTILNRPVFHQSILLALTRHCLYAIGTCILYKRARLNPAYNNGTYRDETSACV